MSDIPTIACFTLFVALFGGLTFHFARLSRERHLALAKAKKEFAKAIESFITNCERTSPYSFLYVYDGEVSRAIAVFREALDDRAQKKFDLIAEGYSQIDRLSITPAHQRHDCQLSHPVMSDDEARPLVLKPLKAMLVYAKKG